MQLNQMHLLLTVAILLNDSHQGENCGAWESSQVQSVQSCEHQKSRSAPWVRKEHSRLGMAALDWSRKAVEAEAGGVLESKSWKKTLCQYNVWGSGLRSPGRYQGCLPEMVRSMEKQGQESIPLMVSLLVFHLP